MPKKGKTVALSAGVVAIAVAASAAYAGRDLAREHWYIHKLRSEDFAERKAAAKELAAMRSARAVPHLIEAIRRDEGEGVLGSGGLIVTQRCSLGGTLAAEEVKVRLATPLAFALWQLGDAAVPGIRRALESEGEDHMKHVLEELLDRREPIEESEDRLYSCR